MILAERQDVPAPIIVCRSGPDACTKAPMREFFVVCALLSVVPLAVLVALMVAL